MTRTSPAAPTSSFTRPTVPTTVRRLSEPMALRIPGVERPWGQTLAHWQAALCSLLREHRLRPEQARSYSTDVALTEDVFVRWQQALDIPAAAASAVPLAYHPRSRALLAARVMADLGVHLRHAWHVQNHTEHLATPTLAAARGPQQLQCGLRRAVRMGEDLALVVLETRLSAPGAGMLSLSRDSFLVPQLPVADLAGLAADRALMREFVGLRHRTADLEPSAQGTCVRWLHLSPEQGPVYAQVSGLPASRSLMDWPAWVRRGRSPGLDGLGLRNRVVRHLSEMGARLDQLSLTLVRRASSHGALCLVVAGRQFEVCDEAGRLVAFGQSAG